MLGLRSLRRRRADSIRVGIALEGGEATILALSPAGAEGPPSVLAWESFATNEAGGLEQALHRFVETHGLRGATARVTLAPGDYELKLVERPTNVPEAELADATRWLIRDLVEMDVETAAIGVLTIPDQKGRARTPHMFVVATRDETVTAMARALDQTGLVCGGFEVMETAMLALEASLPEEVVGGAMVRIDAKSSVLTLATERRLVLARHLRVDAAAMDEAAERALSSAGPGEAELVSALEPLLLDVQRSLDYYESEYGRAPATRLTLLPGSVDLSPLAPALGEMLRPLRVEAYALERAFDFETPPPTRSHAGLSLAAGAAVAGDLALGRALVPARLRAREGTFGLGRVLQAAAVLGLLVVAYCAYEGFRLYGDRQALGAMIVEERELEQTLASAAAEAEQAGLANAAPADPTALRAHRDARLALLRDLGQQRPGTASSFSSLLVGLARQDLDGVWLERIELSESGEALSLTGRTLEAEDVPKLLRGLRDEPAFAGRKFGTLAIERTKDPAAGLQFHVATRGPLDVAAGGDR
ncbi:MAG: PilN domain-containing protein [Deltaproteobacteria bacterium]|nr:PilN domain-containing protein [Deltaproteobacteria bacterium]